VARKPRNREEQGGAGGHALLNNQMPGSETGTIIDCSQWGQIVAKSADSNHVER
jgi:hypothetical protein